MRPVISPLLQLVLAVLFSASAMTRFAAAETLSHGLDSSGTYPGRVLDEIARHRQAVLQRARAGLLPQSARPAGTIDIGNIAVIPDDGTLVTVPNAFDLDFKSVTFQPAADGYTVLASSGGFDAGAAAQGTALNSPGNAQGIGDDDFRQVGIGFPFPFYGTSYTSVFINSDGNLTFLAGDSASSDRSLGRVLGGPPRIAPYFADLDPSVAGQLSYLSSPTRFVVTWNQVPDYASFGIGPRETVQVALTPDGGIQFSYAGINGAEAVVAIAPGNFSNSPTVIDFSVASGQSFSGPAAEVFTRTNSLDVVAVAQRFYQTHEDAYQFLVVFTNFDFSLGGAFAYELNIANQVTGLGRLGLTPTFDYSGDFGSARLESLMNMGNLNRYPADPRSVFLRGVDSTLSILGHEAGHRFLAYTPFLDSRTGFESSALLGRDQQHWSFYFHSDGSVVEGNRIRDNGDGTFTTIGAVDRYSELDQYLMGFREPEEVNPLFLVRNSSLGISPSAAPSIGITFSGQRQDIAVHDIVAANGPRIPNSVTARKRYNFAFVLVTPRGSQATPGEVAHLDRIRREWESFYAEITSFRSAAGTALVRSLEINPSSLGLLAGTQGQVSIQLSGGAGADLAVQIVNSNHGVASVPAQVVIPAGSGSARLPVTALSSGGSLSESRAVITAYAPGFETADLVVQVATGQTAGLKLAIAGGDHQVGPPGSTLPQPLRVSLSDLNLIPYAGQSVVFSVLEGEATLSPGTPITDSQGIASATVQLGAATGPLRVRASLPGSGEAVEFSLTALGNPSVPPLGAFNGASFSLSPPFQPGVSTSSPGALISIFGANLSATTASAASLPLPTALGGTSVEIGGLPARLLYVSPTQINAQVPFELSPAVLTLQVRNSVGAADPIFFAVQPSFPGIFTLNSSGSGPGVILHNDSPLLVSDQSPAIPGEYVQIYATGLGSVSPSVPTGQPGPIQPLSNTLLPASVTIGGVAAPVSFAGLAPGFAGVYQVNVQVPEVPPGTAPVVLTVNGVASRPVQLAVGSQ